MIFASLERIMRTGRGSRTPLLSRLEVRKFLYAAMADVNSKPLDVIDRLACVPNVEHFERPGGRSLLQAEIPLAADEGDGYFGVTRIGADLLVLVENYSLKRPLDERIPGADLIQFNFRLSGDVTLACDGSGPEHMNKPGLFITTQPHGSTLSRATAAGSRERAVVIVLRPRFLMDEFLNPRAANPPRIQDLVSPQLTHSRTRRMPLSGLMFELVGRFLSSRCTGKLALIYTEGLARELLCSAVAELGASASGHRRAVCSNVATRPSRNDSVEDGVLKSSNGATRH